MNTTTHICTPKPWTIVDQRVVDAHGAPVAELVVHRMTTADRLLVLAAPELLAALKHAANDLESRLYLLPVDADETERAILEAQQAIYGRAIAKAEGRP